MRALIVLIIAIATLAVIYTRLAVTVDDSLSVGALLTETSLPAGFRYALEPREFHFPRDHGAHEDYRSEWWYFTGNTTSTAGRDFGFQLTIFRFALRSDRIDSGSPWRNRHVYLGHLAVSDIDGDTFYQFERRGRPALGMAGSAHDPTRIWINDWLIQHDEDIGESWQLRAQHDAVGIELALDSVRAVTAQGFNGLSKKSAAPGNASYYYSISRLAARGTVRLPHGTYSVAGNAWFDHEWSTSALAPGQVGWDWFSLQLDNESELMFYQIRDTAGRADPVSHGVLIAADGTTTPIDADALKLTVRNYWTSRASGVRYPHEWQIEIPHLRVSLRVTPRLAAQEWRQTFTYWEGAVSALGTVGGAPVTGLGYVELVGY